MPAPSHIAFIALGSNLGDRAGFIRQALELLARGPGVKVLARSTDLETAAVGGPAGNPPFLNAAAKVETTLSPADLLSRLLDIERQLGRIRTEKWGPRTIDLDLLLYGNEVIHEHGLQAPHPQMLERRFVLEPLAQIAPDVVHPVARRTIAALLADLGGH